jgi:HlyD family secretion protein
MGLSGMDAKSSGVLLSSARRPNRVISWVRGSVGIFRTHSAIYLAATLLLVLGGAAAWWALGPSKASSYVTVAIGRGTVTRAVTATGAVNPVLTITVGSYVSGVIQEIDCDFNTKVKKGQLCAKIDPRPYQTIVEQDRATLATAKAQLLKDQANLAYTQIDAKRYSNLNAQNATSQDSYDIAVNALKQATAQIAVDQATIGQHNAELDAANVNLGYANIVSPVDGIVVSRNVTIGQTVAASFQTPTLFLIATDLSKMEVDTNVSESDVGGVRAGNKAPFTVEAFPDNTFEAVVTQVRQAPQTVQNVVTYDVVATVDNPGSLLKPGMTATVRVITAKRDNVLRAPDQAFRYVPGGLSSSAERRTASSPQLWVLRDGHPYRVAVTTGLDDDTFTEIVSGGIRTGDKVIVSERTSASGKSTGAGPAMHLP